jgi:hypothetical protein
VKFHPIRKLDTTTGQYVTDKYAIRSDCNRYTVAKVTLNHLVWYEAYRSKEYIGRSRDPEAAKELCAVDAGLAERVA